MNPIGRAFSILTRLGVPQIRRAVPASGSSSVGRVLGPAVQEARGNVVLESGAAVGAPQYDDNGPTIPSSIEMLTANDVRVQAGLLLDALPWQTLREHPPHRVAAGETVARDVEKLFADLQRWKSLGQLVGPQQAVDICKKVATWMSLRDIEHVLQPPQDGALDAVRQVLSTDLNVDKFAQRHTQIVELLAQERVHEAYLRAQAALRSLESAHYLIESARMRVLDAQRRVSQVQWRTWAAAGACIVLGLACDYLAAIPEVHLPIIESVVQSAALSGSVLCLTAASALYLSSDQFASYLDQVRDAKDAHRRVRLKLEGDVESCLEQGYIPQAY